MKTLKVMTMAKIKIILFLLPLWLSTKVLAVDISVTSLANMDAAIAQANNTPTVIDRIVLNIPGFTLGTRVLINQAITAPLILDGSRLAGYQKYFPVAELVLPSRDTSKALTIVGFLFNVGSSTTNNPSPNVIKNNITFVDCNVFKGATGTDGSIMIRNVKSIAFRGCVFSYSLFAKKQFLTDFTFDRISIYKSSNIVFGGNGVDEANVIAGFGYKGIFLFKCTGVQFLSNYIGTVPSTLSNYPIIQERTDIRYTLTNGKDGIYISKCNQVTIGGNANQSTVIGNMVANGVYIMSSSGITIKNSKIGVHNDGITAIPNMCGITIGTWDNGAATELTNVIGTGDGYPGFYSGRSSNIRIFDNVISGNQNNGIQLANTDSILIAGNKIGVDASGKTTVGNGWNYYSELVSGDGINLYNCTRAYIGADVPEAGYPRSYAGNVIGGNRNGICMMYSSRIYVEKNQIGMNLQHGVALPNTANGIAILDSCRLVRIGATEYSDDGYYNSRRNYIGGNYEHGVYMTSIKTQNNWISYNVFGQEGIANCANRKYGIYIYGATNTLIGSLEDVNYHPGNIFKDNTWGHIKLENTRNNFIVLNTFRPSVSNANAKAIDLSLGGYFPSNYSSKAPTITSITTGNNGTTLEVKGTSVLPSEYIELYMERLPYVTAEPIKRTVSSNGQWSMTLTASDGGYIGSILHNGMEGVFLALASCSNNCQSAFNANASLRHNTSEFGPKFKIKIDTYNCEGCIESFQPTPGQKYVLSAWVKEESPSADNYTKAGVKIAFNGNLLQPQTYRAKGKIIDGWQRIEEVFTIPAEAADISITLVNDGAPNVYYDDIRIHPLEGEMKSFVYDPMTQKMLAELDENNYATIYEYDKEGMLVRVKKETEKGVYTIKETRMHQATK